MLTADLLHLGHQMEVLAGTGIELVHIDVMDGVFCPQITLGPPVVKALRTPLLKDVHLMIQDPLTKVEAFVQAGRTWSRSTWRAPRSPIASCRS